MVRIGTLNIRTAWHGNLEAATKGMEEMGLDIAILTDTRLTNDKHMTFSYGYEVYATQSESASIGGVALCVRWGQGRGDKWEVEDWTKYSQNACACTFILGNIKIWLIGVYLPPSDGNGEGLWALT